MTKAPRICLRESRNRELFLLVLVDDQGNLSERKTSVVIFLSSLACRLHAEKRDSSLEQIRSAFSHSDDLRRLATFSCKKIFPNSSFGLSDPHLPPQAGGLLKSALQEPVLPLPPTSQWDPPRAVLLPPAGRALPPQGNWCRTSIWETNYQPRCATEEILRAGSVPPSPAADGFRGCFDPWPSLSNKYHRSRGNTIIRSRQAGPFVGEFVADD